VNAALTELLGYAAAGLVLATFSARSIVTLRVLAIASNLLFIAYAAGVHLPPVLILHALLLPINLLRLGQALAEGRRTAASPKPTTPPGNSPVGFELPSRQTTAPSRSDSPN
jgi:hypothetical protein